MSTKKYTKDLIIYTASTVVSKAIPLLLLLVLSHYFSTSAYGSLTLVQAAIFIFSFIIGGEFITGINRKYFTETSETFSACVSTAITVIFILCSVLIVAGCLYEAHYGKIFSLNLYLCTLSILCAASQAVFIILTSILQMSEKAGQYFIIQFLYSILFVIQVMVAYYTNILTVPLFFLIQIISLVFSSLLNLCFVGRRLSVKFKVNFNELKYLLTYSAPLVIYSVSSFFIVFYLRYIMRDVGGLEMVAIFAIAQQLGMLMSNADFITNKVWTPFAFKLLKDNKKRKFLSSTVKLSCLLFILFIFLVFFNRFLLDTLLPHKYVLAYDCSIWILLGYFFKAIYSLVVCYLQFHKKTLIIGMVNLLIAIFSLLLSKQLILKYGFIGGGISMCISYFLLMFSVSAIVLFRTRKNTSSSFLSATN